MTELESARTKQLIWQRWDKPDRRLSWAGDQQRIVCLDLVTMSSADPGKWTNEGKMAA